MPDRLRPALRQRRPRGGLTPMPDRLRPRSANAVRVEA